MQLCFCESCIQELARRYEEEYLTSRIGELEQELMGMRCQIRENGYLTPDVLEKVVRWTRTQRQLSNIRRNSEMRIRTITSRAFETEDVDESLRILKGLNGVGDTVGSAILHLFHKDPYPFYTQWALECVGERQAPGVWRRYVRYCRDLACRNNVEMRILDRALRRYSNEQRARRGF